MTDRIKLIELLDGVPGVVVSAADYGVIADHLIANGVVISNLETTTTATDNNVGDKMTPTAENLSAVEWIPVTERLPKVDEIVMCYRTGKMFLGTYLGANFAPDVAAFKAAEEYYARGATHWMPLPEPPKGE